MLPTHDRLLALPHNPWKRLFDRPPLRGPRRRPMDALAVALALLAACGSDQKTCQVDRQCPDGLVCLLFEDSLEGACYPPACAAEWMGYGCDTSDTGT